jgi:HK97 family phage prohead protease
MTDPTGALTRAAPLRASSWNADELTFDLVLSAGAPVERGGFVEVLDVAGATWPESIPLLDSHNRGRLEDQIGTVGNIRNEGGEIVATARLSKHSPLAQRIAAELSDGAKYGVSIGYSVSKWAESKPNGKRTLTAKAFEIIEASLVSIPADPAATIRSIPNVTTENTEITRAQINTEIRAIAKTASLDQAWIDSQIDADATLDQVRAAALDAMSKRSPVISNIKVGTDHTDPVSIRSAMAEALAHRLAPGAVKLEGRATGIPRAPNLGSGWRLGCSQRRAGEPSRSRRAPSARRWRSQHIGLPAVACRCCEQGAACQLSGCGTNVQKVGRP